MTQSVSMGRVRFKLKALTGRGIGVDEAVAAAERNLDQMRERILAEVDLQIAVIRDLTPALAREDATASETVVQAADVLTGLCVTPDLAPIGEAARTICKLSDEVEGVLPAEAAKLLGDTMLFLREQQDDTRCAAWLQLREGVEAAVKTAAHRRLPKAMPASAHRI